MAYRTWPADRRCWKVFSSGDAKRDEERQRGVDRLHGKQLWIEMLARPRA